MRSYSGYIVIMWVIGIQYCQRNQGIYNGQLLGSKSKYPLYSLCCRVKYNTCIVLRCQPGTIANEFYVSSIKYYVYPVQ